MATKKLVEQYAKSFPKKLKSANGMRTIGRESEYPVVESDGTAGSVQVSFFNLSHSQLIISSFFGKMKTMNIVIL
jgi:hypothetical protein